jgi:methylmalonyl-CoA/ethylmalonyl-CoA epimerase
MISPLTKVIQLAFVVNNLEAGIERYRQMFGLTSWEVYTLAPPSLKHLRYHGNPGQFSLRQAVAMSKDGMQYELIEPLTGPSIYHDFLELHGEGLHHIACDYTGSFDEAISQFSQLDVVPVMQGHWGEIRFAYMDTEKKIGTCVEIWDIPNDYKFPIPEKIVP